MPQEKKPEKPKDVYIESQYWPAKRGVQKATLVVTMEDLAEILLGEQSLISDCDVPRLMGALHTYAARNEGSERGALDEWEGFVEELEEAYPDPEAEPPKEDEE